MTKTCGTISNLNRAIASRESGDGGRDLSDLVAVCLPRGQKASMTCAGMVRSIYIQTRFLYFGL